MTATKSNGKNDRARTVGVRVELNSGDSVLVRPWGFDEIEEHMGDVYSLISELMTALDQMGDQPSEGSGGESDEAATLGEQVHDGMVTVLTRNLRRLRGLIVASLEHGEEDLAKMAGFVDIYDTMEAIVDANGIVEVVGKAQATMRKVNSMNLPQDQTTKSGTRTKSS